MGYSNSLYGRISGWGGSQLAADRHRE